MRLYDIVRIEGLEGGEWGGWNGRQGVLDWRDADEARVATARDESITLPLRNLRGTKVNVAPGAPVCAVGLASSDWRPLNDHIGSVVGSIDELGRVPVAFAAPWGSVSLLPENIATPQTAGSLVSPHHAASPASDAELQSGLAYMFREGTLVEVHGLTSEEWVGLNGVTGVVTGPVVAELDAFRVPVSFCDPWGDLPMLVANVRAAANAKYISLVTDPLDATQGLTLEGTRVATIRQGSAAHRAGVQSGDVVRAVSKHPVFHADEAHQLIESVQGTCLLTVQTAGVVDAAGIVRHISRLGGESPTQVALTMASQHAGPHGGFTPVYENERFQRASARCPDCGGSVSLQQRCPKTGLAHSESGAHRSYAGSHRYGGPGAASSPPAPKPPIRRKGSSDASIVSQLARAIDAIEQANPTPAPNTPLPAIPSLAMHVGRSTSPVPAPEPPLRTGRPLYLI